MNMHLVVFFLVLILKFLLIPFMQNKFDSERVEPRGFDAL